MIERIKREPALIVALIAMSLYTAARVYLSDLTLDTVLTEDYLTYAMGTVAAIATRMKVWSKNAMNKKLESYLASTQDRGDVPDVPPRKS